MTTSWRVCRGEEEKQRQRRRVNAAVSRMAATRRSYHPTSFRHSGDRATMTTTMNDDDDDDDDDGDIVVWEEARAVVTSLRVFFLFFCYGTSDKIEALN